MVFVQYETCTIIRTPDAGNSYYSVYRVIDKDNTWRIDLDC